MNLNNLEATLYYDKINVKGLARISLSGKSCDFLSEFVPILPLNSQVTIITTVKNAPYLKITGPVFLSSKKLMRIQPCTLALYEDAENYFDVPVKIQAQKVKKHFFSPETYEDLEIVKCSAESLTLTGGLFPDHGDREITILVDYPIFPDSAYIDLEYAGSGFFFGQKNTGNKSAKYLYRITGMENDDRILLQQFIRRQGIELLARAMKN